MNKLLVITVLAAMLAINVEGFRVSRQAEEDAVMDAVMDAVVEAVQEEVQEAVQEEVQDPVQDAVQDPVQAPVQEEVVEAVQEEVQEQGTLSKMTNAFRGYYENTVNTASGYLDNVKGLKLEEKAKNFYDESTKVMSTYAGIVQDQMYHIFTQQQ